MKVIIAGGRDFDNYDNLGSFFNKCLDFSNLRLNELEIVSGTARGADKLGERYADKIKVKVKQFPANWDAHGKAAGYIRNEEMAKYADCLIAFWDGKSKGTKHMIDLALKHKLETHIKIY